MSSNQPKQGCCDGRAIFPLVTQILSIIIGLIAFILSAVAISGCNFLHFGSDANLTLGLFKGGSKITVQCLDYSSDSKFTGSWKAAQAMGAIAAAIGGITMTACLFMLMFRFPVWLWKTIGSCYVSCFVFQMLTLLILANPLCAGEVDGVNARCKLGDSAVTGIIAAIFYLGIGITMLICPVPKTAVITCCGDCCKDGCGEEEGCDCFGEKSTQVVQTSGNRSIEGSTIYTNTVGGAAAAGGVGNTTTETYNADGSVTINEETINPDGSKTVSTTTRPATSVNSSMP